MHAIANCSDQTSYIISGDIYMIPLEQIRNLPPGAPATPTKINSVDVIGRTIYRVENGTKYKLLPVSEYESTGNEEMIL